MSDPLDDARRAFLREMSPDALTHLDAAIKGHVRDSRRLARRLGRVVEAVAVLRRERSLDAALEVVAAAEAGRRTLERLAG